MARILLGRQFGYVRLMWEPRDLWIGVYWTGDGSWTSVYVCLVPCLPIVIGFWNRRARAKV